MNTGIPVDLHIFWQRTLERLRSQPLDAKAESLRPLLPYDVYKVSFRSLDGVPVRAYLAMPIDAMRDQPPLHPLPAIVTGPGYGGREFGLQLNECQRGYAILQVYPRSQGESADLWRVEDAALGAWVKHGKASPEGFFYQGAYADMVRGLDYLLTRPDIDPNRIGTMGTSQGGLLSLGMAAIEPRFRAVVAHLPCMCDFSNHNGFPPGMADDVEFQRTWRYFDPVFLASFIRSPTLLSIGGQDSVCPPPGIRAVYDRLAGIKALAEFPDQTHTSSAPFYAMSWHWMDRYLR